MVRRWLIIWSLLLAALVSCGSQASTASLPAPGGCLHANGPFVRAQGTQFVVGTTPVHLLAATIYPDETVGNSTYRGSAWLRADFPAYISRMLDLAVAAHLNTIRATDFLNAAPDWRTPQVWLNLDSLLCQAQARGMHVIISLTTFGNRLRKAGQFPYTPTDWQAYLTFVGQRYQHVSAIAYYAIAGEALPPNGHDPLRPTTDQLVAFYRATATTLAQADAGNHLISTGGLSFLNGDYGIPWQTIFALPHIALAAIHVYSVGDRDVSLPMVAAWAAQHDKPFMLEEFGFRQNLGDAARGAAFADIAGRARTAGAAGLGFWNLGPEVAPQSYDISPATPLTWQVVQQSA